LPKTGNISAGKSDPPVRQYLAEGSEFWKSWRLVTIVQVHSRLSSTETTKNAQKQPDHIMLSCQWSPWYGIVSRSSLSAFHVFGTTDSSPRGPGCLFSLCSCQVIARRWSVESSQPFFNTMVLTGHEETTAPARCGTSR